VRVSIIIHPSTQLTLHWPDGFNGFLPSMSWMGIRLIYLFDNPATRLSTHTLPLSMGSVKGIRSIPSLEPLFHAERGYATCSVTKASSWCMHPRQYTCSESWPGQSADPEWVMRHCILPEGRVSSVLCEKVQAPRLKSGAFSSPNSPG